MSEDRDKEKFSGLAVHLLSTKLRFWLVQRLAEDPFHGCAPHQRQAPNSCTFEFVRFYQPNHCSRVKAKDTGGLGSSQHLLFHGDEPDLIYISLSTS